MTEDVSRGYNEQGMNGECALSTCCGAKTG